MGATKLIDMNLLGTKIRHYHVRIYFQKKWYQNDEFSSKAYQVVLENDKYIIIENSIFTRLRKKNSNIELSLEKEYIDYIEIGHILDGGICYDLYTTKKKRPSTIKRAIKTYLKERIYLLRDVDLDFIK